MNVPTIHGTAGAFPASKLLEAVGERLADIRKANGLTWADVGAAFGKSDDQAAQYATGFADMPLSAWVRGTKAFGETFGDVAVSFAGYRLCPLDAPKVAHRAMPRVLTAALLKLTAAVENDDEIKDDELRDASVEILEAGRLFDALRDRLAVLGFGGDEA